MSALTAPIASAKGVLVFLPSSYIIKTGYVLFLRTDMIGGYTHIKTFVNGASTRRSYLSTDLCFNEFR